MSQLDWIKDLVEVEQKMEESGIIDVTYGIDEEKQLEQQTVLLLNRLKDLFIDASTVYNKMRGLSVGGVKIYGISRTVADFMLFRNGYKLFFSMKRAGNISIKIHYHGTDILTPQAEVLDSIGTEDMVEARWGAFGEVVWTHQETPVNSDYLVRYYFSKFVRESTK